MSLGGFDEVRVSADSELLERAEVRYGKAALVHKPLPMYLATYHDQSLTGGGPFAILVGEVFVALEVHMFLPSVHGTKLLLT